MLNYVGLLPTCIISACDYYRSPISLIYIVGWANSGKEPRTLSSARRLQMSQVVYHKQ